MQIFIFAAMLILRNLVLGVHVVQSLNLEKFRCVTCNVHAEVTMMDNPRIHDLHFEPKGSHAERHQKCNKAVMIVMGF